MCVERLCTRVLDLSPQSKEDVGRGLRRGCIRLKRALVGTGEEDECGLSIHVANRTCLLKGKLCPSMFVLTDTPKGLQWKDKGRYRMYTA